jgi:hypothetical protein
MSFPADGVVFEPAQWKYEGPLLSPACRQSPCVSSRPYDSLSHARRKELVAAEYVREREKQLATRIAGPEMTKIMQRLLEGYQARFLPPKSAFSPCRAVLSSRFECWFRLCHSPASVKRLRILRPGTPRARSKALSKFSFRGISSIHWRICLQVSMTVRRFFARR